MMEICDMHCHILPGVDDGARTMEESMQALRMASRQHVRGIIVTPHFHPGRYQVSAQEIYECVDRLQCQCNAEGIDMMFYPGAECYYYSGLVEELNSGAALPLAGSRYVLVEFSPGAMYSHMRGGLRDLQNAGYQPILAHFERYDCLRDRENLLQLRQDGILLQMNFDTLVKKDRMLHRYPWKRMAREGLVDYFGSDCHGVEFRPFHAKEAADWCEENLSNQSLNRIFYDNIARILANK